MNRRTLQHAAEPDASPIYSAAEMLITSEDARRSVGQESASPATSGRMGKYCTRSSTRCAISAGENVLRPMYPLRCFIDVHFESQ
jgi:hypothetical protein